MNLLSLITDNITELLVKIIEFTQRRQKVLIQNIYEANRAGFVPEDLLVEEFCDLLRYAIDEHIRHRRLVLYDTESIKFGFGGDFEAKPVVDEYARKLLKENRDKYLQLQINKLFENSLNQRIAAEMLRQKQESFLTGY